MYRTVFILVIIYLSSFSVINTGTGEGSKKIEYIKAGKLNIYTEVQGKGFPLLLLHGGYLDHHMWDLQVRFFRSYYEVITIDLPGHSGTSGVDTSLKTEDAIRIVLDSLKIKNINLVGLSLGSMCALDFTIAYPDRVNRLVLVSSGFWQNVLKIDSVSKRLFAISDSVELTHNTHSIARNFMDTWCVGPYRTENQVNSSVRSYVYRTTLQNLARKHPSWPVFDRNHSAASLKNINCPVFLIAGDKDVPHIRETISYLDHNIRGAKVYTVKNAAHMLNMEQPGLFNQQVKKFLSD
jgi:3-oxoadipate enol-lactonase